MNKIVILIIALFILVLAALTNPDQNKHQAAVEDKVKVLLSNQMEIDQNANKDEWESAGDAIGMLFGGWMVEKLVDNMIVSKNYLFFSTTVARYRNEERTIGFGIFGNVFISNKLDQAIKDDLLDENV